MVYATEQGEGEIALGAHVLRVTNVIFCKQLRDTLLSVVGLQQAGHRFDLGSAGGTFVDNAQSYKVPLSFDNGILTFVLDPLDDRRMVPPDKVAEEICVTTRAQLRGGADATPLQPAAQPAIASRSPAPSSDPQPSVPSDAKSAVSTGSNDLRLAHLRYGHLCGAKLAALLQNPSTRSWQRRAHPVSARR